MKDAETLSLDLSMEPTVFLNNGRFGWRINARKEDFRVVDEFRAPVTLTSRCVVERKRKPSKKQKSAFINSAKAIKVHVDAEPTIFNPENAHFGWRCETSIRCPVNGRKSDTLFLCDIVVGDHESLDEIDGLVAEEYVPESSSSSSPLMGVHGWGTEEIEEVETKDGDESEEEEEDEFEEKNDDDFEDDNDTEEEEEEGDEDEDDNADELDENDDIEDDVIDEENEKRVTLGDKLRNRIRKIAKRDRQERCTSYVLFICLALTMAYLAYVQPQETLEAFMFGARVAGEGALRVLRAIGKFVRHTIGN